MATRKTLRTPQQASLFDDPAPEPAQHDVPAAAPTRARTGKKAAEAAPARAAQPQAGAADVPHLAAQFDALPAVWRDVLKPFTDSDAYAPLCRFVDDERAAGKTVYPTDVFRALRLTSPDDVKVVILGQDPYHGDDRGTPQAHGLAFSVPPAVRTPPSLRNIFKEIAANFGHDTPRHGCLDTWARQGVLLLNTVLTVERGAAASHAKRGWEQCTDTLIRELAGRHRGLVFMLWGAHAQAKRALFDANAHCVLEAPHPSPLSAHRGFLGCRHFALANEYLVEAGREPIDWRLPEIAETLA
ncbi:uracil-DNA glycosylase [Burkholderia vietnamiensis]|uniref:Uracil-DNA glycosylase n=1 Tax=Burkholderia vietnamiensis TaxID=60552 RepID=A0AAW7T5R0_BURVI|nr:uracil-DNA glycosylase [Burkholderia vietnamiensis]AJY07685.1 uracil-DNA glycosylase [Burkholderia vietnamiensis LMG 10929]AVR15641.1 uracil-DNA glycosylase [Burkholderia vietnamiensis]KKI39925.1 uracil-DNA glycosylase [Burkholderia vietnamiensis]KVE62187.1 uracil-DNA glycosylase [Burkholderia vietnamiensis]KVF29951.1 uracil-DNA glycosylase [Burkholderia vietnamiensis]